MKDCIFCKISQGEAPAKIEYEDDSILAFDDINPKAPIHVLIIPKKHIRSINDLKQGDGELLFKMIFVAKKLAKKLKIAESGYKLIFNVGKEGGQLVSHLHLHLLGGKLLRRLDV